MHRDNTGCVIKKDERKIENLPIFVTETIAIRTALKHTIQENYSRLASKVNR